jgi:hypothetical protein
VREQDRTLEREHSIYGFHKQVNLVERTWNDDLRAMSYGLGIAIVISSDRTKRDFANSLFRSSRHAADERDELARIGPLTSGHPTYPRSTAATPDNLTRETNTPGFVGSLPNSLLQASVNSRATEDRSGRSCASEARADSLRDHRPSQFSQSSITL